MSHESIVGRTPHECRRDFLPRFGDFSHRYDDGEIVRCGVCGKLWLVESAKFCNYKRLRPRQIRKLVKQGVLTLEAAGETP